VEQPQMLSFHEGSRFYLSRSRQDHPAVNVSVGVLSH